jgi:ATP-dependent RNA helicase HelY
VVLDPAQDATDPRPRVMSLHGDVKRIGVQEVGDSGVLAGRVNMPPTFDSRSAKSRSWLADRLKETARSGPSVQREAPSRPNDAEINRLRKALRAHPCHGCDEREQHARWHERIATATKDITKLEGRVETRTSSIAREFDRICAVLLRLGYLEQVRGEYRVTEAGIMLGRIYCERDLLAAECLRRGLWAGLEPDQVAAVASTLVYSSRREDEEQPALPTGAVADTVAEMANVWGEIRDVEEQCRADLTPVMDAGYVWPALRWARGQAMSKVLHDNDIAPGDFVRWAKQVIDITGQIAAAASDESVARAAHSAVGALNRGIVAW